MSTASPIKINLQMNIGSRDPTTLIIHPLHRLEKLRYALNQVPGITVESTDSLPPQSIGYEGKPLAYIDHEDPWYSSVPRPENRYLAVALEEVQPKIIFKYQYKPGAAYPPGTLSAGYIYHAFEMNPPSDVLTRARSMDITARMSVENYHREDYPFIPKRKQVIKQAQIMREQGFKVGTGMIDQADYFDELWNVKVGYNWRGIGKLTYRMGEYFRAGVVMITDPLGPEWPMREDIILEDGVHCVFCERPEDFGRVSLALLNDPRKMQRIRKNAFVLWQEKLSPPAMGAWYWSKLKPLISALYP